jgi:hypothetical protein
MILKAYIRCLPFVVIGLYLVIAGATSKTLISEYFRPATEEEKANAEATPMGRLIVIGAGLAGIIYGLRHWPR